MSSAGPGAGRWAAGRFPMGVSHSNAANCHEHAYASFQMEVNDLQEKVSFPRCSLDLFTTSATLSPCKAELGSCQWTKLNRSTLCIVICMHSQQAGLLTSETKCFCMQAIQQSELKI